MKQHLLAIGCPRQSNGRQLDLGDPPQYFIGVLLHHIGHLGIEEMNALHHILPNLFKLLWRNQSLGYVIIENQRCVVLAVIGAAKGRDQRRNAGFIWLHIYPPA
ncbi:hypothetical protein D3C76_1569110 [compost metagenome]